jgi:hypothetical protein
VSNGPDTFPQEDIFREILERDRTIAESKFETLLKRLDAQSEFDRLISRKDVADAARRQRRLEQEAAEQALRNSARSKLIRRLSIALKFLGAGFEAIGFEIELIKALREKEDFESLQEEEALNEWIRQKLARRAKDKKLRTTVMQPDAGGDGLPPEHPGRPTSEEMLRRTPSRAPGRPDIITDPIRFPVGVPDIPDFPRPDIARPTAPEARRPRVVKPDPFELPSTATPGIRPEVSTFEFPAPSPGLFSAPSPATRLRTRRKPDFPRLTSFEPVLLQSPRIAPQPLTQTQPQLEEPTRRQRKQKCYKGLYKERRDGSISKTRWARIDCDTGEELGDKRRTRKKNQVEKPNQVQPHLASLQGFSIRPG